VLASPVTTGNKLLLLLLLLLPCKTLGFGPAI